MTRPSIVQTLFQVAEAWEKRSTCPRGRAGCVVATTRGEVLSQGYNGAPRGVAHCVEDGCVIEPGVCPKCSGSGIIYSDERAFAIDCPRCGGSRVLGGHCIRSVHAEMNAIIWAARRGAGLEGSTLVSTVRPCIRCSMAIIQAGIETIWYDRAYQSDDETTAFRLLSEAGVSIKHRELA